MAASLNPPPDSAGPASEQAQREVGIAGPQQRVALAIEHGLERVEVARLVVDEEQLDVIVRHRYNHTRSKLRSWSVLTGFAM